MREHGRHYPLRRQIPPPAQAHAAGALREQHPRILAAPRGGNAGSPQAAPARPVWSSPAHVHPNIGCSVSMDQPNTTGAAPKEISRDGIQASGKSLWLLHSLLRH
ncbi:hypothetical protein IEO21_10744 [Rhodonia placenta]|uniref:Uncharacterized protein n=1 Tax=Rhodonia placenta TaxID=104341 RepID=A0A8H7NRW8_9APHY|nr:hypothetical protein IEO21_10744 [Postia placenta]